MEPDAHMDPAAPDPCDDELQGEVINNFQGLSLEDKCGFIQSLVEKSQTLDGSVESQSSFYQECRKTKIEGLKMKDLRELGEINEERIIPIVIVGCRKLLVNATTSLIQDFINFGFHKSFLALLKDLQNEDLIYEILWCFVNVLSLGEEHTRACTDQGIIKILLPFISHPNNKIKFQAFWACGNIAGSGSEYQHILFKEGAYDVIIEQALKEPADGSNFRNVSCTLYAFITNFNECSDEQVSSITDVFINGLEMATKDEILSDCACGLQFISKRITGIFKIVERGALSKMVQLLQNPDAMILLCLLNTFCNMTCENVPGLCNDLVQNGFISSVTPILSHPDTSVKQAALQCLSNMACDLVFFCDHLINSHILDKVLLFLDPEELELYQESCYIIFNMASHLNLNIIQRLHQKGALAKICETLMNDSYSPNCKVLILKTIECCLETYRKSDVCDAQNHMKNLLLTPQNSNNGLQKLKDFGDHPHNKIRELAELIVTKHFPDDE